MDCIVIGNGESLNRTPLEKLAKKFDTFGCNRIHLLPFRPTYYVRVEPPAFDGTAKQFFEECRLHIENDEYCIFPSGWREELGEYPNVEYVEVCRRFKYHHLSRKFHDAWHLPTLCDANAVTAMMQIAALKGYSRIILVGCDISGEHFSRQDNGIVDAERLRRVHEVAKTSCPIPIFNATLGGALDVYPRIEMSALC